MKLLAQAGALSGIAGHRHKAAWKVTGVEAPTPLMRQPRVAEGTPLRAPSEGEVVHLIAGRLEDHRRLLGKLQTKSRDFQ